MKKLTIVLTKRFGLATSETINVELDGGSKEECKEALEMAKMAVVNSWMTQIEETEEEPTTYPEGVE